MTRRAHSALRAAVAAAAVLAGAHAHAAPCAGFADVDASSPFCASLEWIANRAITLGCASGLYCPSDPVVRLHMAAFLHRLGGVLTPTVIRAEQPNVAVVSQGLVCQTADLPARPHPRSATIHARFTGRVSGAAEAATAIVVTSVDGGSTWANASPLGGPTGPFGADVPSTLADTVVADVAAGAPVRFALRVATAIGESARGDCALIAAVGNRNVATAP